MAVITRTNPGTKYKNNGLGTGCGAQKAISMKKLIELINVNIIHALQACDCLYDIIKKKEMRAMA
jgi:hypothetical protein